MLEYLDNMSILYFYFPFIPFCLLSPPNTQFKTTAALKNREESLKINQKTPFISSST